MKPKRINSSLFRWDNSARATYISLTQLWDSDREKPLCPIIGYCEGGSVNIAPKADTYAVMFELNEEFVDDEVWTHLPKVTFDQYLGTLK